MFFEGCFHAGQYDRIAFFACGWRNIFLVERIEREPRPTQRLQTKQRVAAQPNNANQ